MTKEEYDNLNTFPIEMVTKGRYYFNNEKIMKPGDTFIAVKKATLGTNDYSVIDINGHPHHYEGCYLLFKD